ncbi:MAG: hypothetical protein H6865_05405 [Rhodospirillales bacterium]|nr:hypothetical protein [Alphaproteobacteria bacterium]MCB9987056.1 hypothetical protein [Rhodospirillales bacterium]USO08176.1 MAG: hypothetical protein H6866_02885 [Rhodospirillales bacterium]
MRLALFIIALALVTTPAQAQDFKNPAAAEAASENVIGTILAVDGLATVNIFGRPKPALAKPSMALHPQDLVTTGPRARVFVQMIDDTQFTLGENTQWEPVDFAFAGQNDRRDTASYKVTKGSIAYQSGLMGQNDNAHIRIEILYGTLAVQGGAFWAGMVNGEYGVLDRAGRVAVDTGGGRARLVEGQGTILHAKGQAPGPVSTWDEPRALAAFATTTLRNPAIVDTLVKGNAKNVEALREAHAAAIASRPERPDTKSAVVTKPETTDSKTAAPREIPDAMKAVKPAPLAKSSETEAEKPSTPTKADTSKTAGSYTPAQPLAVSKPRPPAPDEPRVPDAPKTLPKHFDTTDMTMPDMGTNTVPGFATVGAGAFGRGETGNTDADNKDKNVVHATPMRPDTEETAQPR